jgi:hypothetical protein
MNTEAAEELSAPSTRARPTWFRRHRRDLLLGAVVVVALTAIGWGAVFAVTYFLVDQDRRLPHHEVTITNDTSKAISWNCTWSDLSLGPGQTGSIEILNDPGEDFGCEYGNHSLIPPIEGMKSGRHFVVSDWLKNDESP